MSTPKWSLTFRLTACPPVERDVTNGGRAVASTPVEQSPAVELDHAGAGDGVGGERVARELGPVDDEHVVARARRAASPWPHRRTVRRRRRHRGAACQEPRPRSAVAPGIGSSFRSGWHPATRPRIGGSGASRPDNGSVENGTTPTASCVIARTPSAKPVARSLNARRGPRDPWRNPVSVSSVSPVSTARRFERAQSTVRKPTSAVIGDGYPSAARWVPR